MYEHPIDYIVFSFHILVLCGNCLFMMFRIHIVLLFHRKNGCNIQIMKKLFMHGLVLFLEKIIINLLFVFICFYTVVCLYNLYYCFFPVVFLNTAFRRHTLCTLFRQHFVSFCLQFLLVLKWCVYNVL